MRKTPKRLVLLLCLMNMISSMVAGSFCLAEGEVNDVILASNIIKLRDPSVIKADGIYYLFGTDWICYKSETLDGKWEYVGGAVEYPQDMVADRWAPEVYEYNGAYYMFTTYKSKETGYRGCAVFRSDNAAGKYTLHSDGYITPREADAIDGHLYVDKDGQPWMVYVNEWTSTEDGVGRFSCAKLSADLKQFISAPVEMFRADDAAWSKSVVTDGCWVYTCQDGSLLMLWSSWDEFGYCVGLARSASGDITGPWEQLEDRLFSKGITGQYDGGHGMLFTDYDGNLWMSLHSPNSAQPRRNERPVFIPLKEENNMLVWDFESR